MSATEDDSNDAVEPNHAQEEPTEPGCGPGGRGFESRRSPLKSPANFNTNFQGVTARSGDGVQTGSKVSSEIGSEESDEDPPSTVAEQLAGRLRGDEADLFLAFNRRLVRTTQFRGNTSPDTADDACAFAWIQFMRHQPDRNRHWRAWLFTTAEREAWRLHREAVETLPEDPGIDAVAACVNAVESGTWYA